MDRDHANAALAELKGIIDGLIQRAVTMAVEAAVKDETIKKLLADLEEAVKKDHRK